MMTKETQARDERADEQPYDYTISNSDDNTNLLIVITKTITISNNTHNNHNIHNDKTNDVNNHQIVNHIRHNNSHNNNIGWPGPCCSELLDAAASRGEALLAVACGLRFYDCY